MARLDVRFAAILAVLASWPVRAAADGFGWPQYQKKPDSWFASAEAKRVAENVLSHQSPYGDWPKNIDTGAQPYQGDPKDLDGTFDNSATLGETRFLARMYRVTAEPRYQTAMLKAIDHVFEAQYANGGWPQYSPPPARGYNRYITFNDNAMIKVMEFVRDLARSKDFDMLDPGRRQKAQETFDRGVRCILACQIVVDGKLTAWCAQHDDVTLEPRKARSYEHPSLSGAESAGIVRFLMTLENPSPEIVRAIHAACQWYEDAKLTGIRQTEKNGDKVIVPDPAAPPLWARFYQIGTNRPIFSGRDGVIKYDIAQIEAERRNGYSWYGEWGKDVAKDFQTWKAAHR